MKVIATEKLPIKMWAEDVEDGAMEQLKNLANLPFAFKHIAVMPDCHQGYGMPIGGVLATRNCVIPSAAGVDIGCGMHAVQTNLRASEVDTDSIKAIMGNIREQIPVGFSHRQAPVSECDMPNTQWGYKSLPVVAREYESARCQMGTLGGGNHFIEIQVDEKGMIWLMIHSGSRNLGKQVADHYNKLAVNFAKIYCTSVPPAWELAHLPISTVEGQTYMKEMQYCVDFAQRNRGWMMNQVLIAVAGELNMDEEIVIAEYDVAHNYARMEHHFGSDVMVHRKGATLARDRLVGVIPGSQGTASYIVLGKGNPQSFDSCSHGAGRRMGRKEAIRSLDLAQEIARLDERGILHSIRYKDDLDEAPPAYKDIDAVMHQQRDLVEIMHRLTPLAVVKA